MRIIVFILLLSLNSYGFTANWKRFGQSKSGNTFFIDIDNIKIFKEHVYYFTLIDYPKLTKIGTFSDVSEYKVDCVGQKQTWLNNKIYSQSMAQGKVVINGIPVWNHYGSTLNETRYLEPGSIEQRILLYVCDSIK